MLLAPLQVFLIGLVVYGCGLLTYLRYAEGHEVIRPTSMRQESTDLTESARL